MSWAQNLQARWKVNSVFQVIIILVVFACTGFTVLFLKRPVFQYLFPDGVVPLTASILYWVFIFPIYNIFLLFYGFIFGQFRFFWEFEKRFFNRIFSKFSSHK
ncbi:MAG: DUF6787 family protein [Bacteroidota bacterium]